jgi:PAS domain S-box-containing protein
VKSSSGSNAAQASQAERARAVSLERKLPLFMTGVLALGLATALALTYATLADSTRDTASERLSRATRQLASLGATSTTRLKALVGRVAKDTAVVRALVSSTAPTRADTTEAYALARRALGLLLVPTTDSMLGAELWTLDGRRVLHVGRDTRSADQPRVGDSANPGPPLAGEGLEGLESSDSARIGSMFASGKEVNFWVAAPVLANGRRVGYVTQRRLLRNDPNILRTLRELYGGEVTAYYRNTDRPFWTTITGEIVAAPELRDSSGVVRVVERAGAGDLISAEERIAGTPLAVILEAPLGDVLASPRRTLLRMAMISLAILLAGAAISWGLSRRLTQPLVSLTSAAESLAGGDFSVRVATDRGDEIGRLATSFNRMAEEVGISMAAVEEREAQFRALADAIPQLSWMARADGHIFWYNKRWYAFTGTTPEQMQGWGWQAVHDPSVLPSVLTRWRVSLESGEPFEMEFPIRGADGEYRWFLTRVEPLKDREGRVARWFGTSTDVQALRDAREAAKSASQAKSDFLTTMSHELRTPLNAIGGYSDLLEMELRGPVNPAQRRDLERIKASQQHLLGLISGMLDLSRIESGTVAYHLTPVALDPLLAGLDALVGPQASTKSLVLDYSPAATELAVLADREKLRQVLLNLISNAVRYTPAGGSVTLSAAPHGDHEVAIVVTDTGVGIPAEKLEHIFEPFVQLDRSLTQSREGVGLGLAISRDLARGMGGELSVESTVGVGSRFTLVLPRASLEEAEGITSTSGEVRAVRTAS